MVLYYIFTASKLLLLFPPFSSFAFSIKYVDKEKKMINLEDKEGKEKKKRL